MKTAMVQLLACPQCGSDLRLDAAKRDGERVEEGTLTCARCPREYTITGSVPRFVDRENYASNFGFQWNRFRQTQLDSYTGTTISRDRFLVSTGWSPEELAGKRVLDVGCGAGRFTEVALDFGAQVVAADYSSAVDACWANNRRFPNLDVVQADVYRLPFNPGSFDYVFCLGVLQHTPDVKAAFLELPAQVRPGGSLAVDVYPKLKRTLFSSKYWVRPLTKRLPQQKLFGMVERMVPVLLPVTVALGRIPVVGRQLKWLVPVSSYDRVFPLNGRQLREWAILDTFDMLGSRYDQPQTASTLRSWFGAAGMKDVEIFRHGHLVGRGRR